MINILKLESV